MNFNCLQFEQERKIGEKKGKSKKHEKIPFVKICHKDDLIVMSLQSFTRD